mmetsp:Transcript_52042/g.116817  ORF Transcript_52042/g.116817 Transcript_52042/m.116817 type:complete len:384 (+) Transcript_52042:62-1213(+)
MAESPHRNESATYFYIGDDAPKTPVVLHCFRAKGPQREVPISPGGIFAEACLRLAAAAGQKLITVEARHPETHCFGELPGAFVQSRRASAPLLLALLKAQRLACEVPAADYQAAWAARAEASLAPLVSLALWAFGPCYRQHTRAAVLRGSCTAAWPMSLAFCLRKRWRARALAVGGTRSAIKDLEPELCRFLAAWKERAERLSDCEVPTLDELIFWAHGLPLIEIPEALSPVAPEIRQQLRAFVEAIDVRLKRAQKMSVAAAPLRWASAEEAEELLESSYPTLPKPLLASVTEVNGVARMPGGHLEVTALPQIWTTFAQGLGALREGLRETLREGSRDGDDMPMNKLSKSQVQGNWIFAACVLSTTVGFVAWSLRSMKAASSS